MKLLHISLILSISLAFCGKDNSKTSEQTKIQTVQPHQKGIDAQVPGFNGSKAYSYLTAQTDFGPRVPGSRAHEKCIAYLQKEMNKYADVVMLQPFSMTGYDNKTLTLNNLISSFNLSATTRILLLAHWDSRPRSDQDPDPKKQIRPVSGANDGASGVAVLLEIARCLKESKPNIGVDILFTDGEDYGKEGDTKNYLLGAQYFAKNLPDGFRPAFGILLDMIGDAQLEIRKERYSLNFAPDIVDLIWSTARDLGVQQFSDNRQGWVTDDHLPLNNAGIKTIDLIDFNYPDETNRYWHTTEDTPDKCSPESLEAVGTVLLHVIYQYKP